ncbi:hypothetical protein [Thalassoglobus sp.]|uniref:hypothetical protein n=1 Tax=Thalassoglobus sp. TaxID=2795869 RepID=UPI003AA81AA2
MNRSNHDRQLLKAAVMLKEAYDTTQLPTATHSFPTESFPTEQWQRIQRLERQQQLAEKHGYAVAAQSCRQRLSEQIRCCVQELQQYEMQLSQTLRSQSVPSLQMLYAELQALDDEFVDVEIDRVLKEVVVGTEPIVLEGIDLGRFQIRLSLKRVGVQGSFGVTPLDPNPSSPDDNVSHPHVQGDSLCPGEGTQAINNALAAGRLTDFFLTVRQILLTYNSSSAYVSLCDWHGVACGACGDMVNRDDCRDCERCQESLCDSCSRHCQGCEVTLCNECSETCTECDDSYCRDCLENELCPSCLELEDLSNWFAGSASWRTVFSLEKYVLHGHTVEQTALEMEDHDDESEDTPAPPTTPATTTSEATAKTNTSHATVQSLCLGKVITPA